MGKYIPDPISIAHVAQCHDRRAGRKVCLQFLGYVEQVGFVVIDQRHLRGPAGADLSGQLGANRAARP